MIRNRTKLQLIRDFVLFPLRALFLHERDRWWGSSLASERFDYAAREVTGNCLDFGCGRHNRFVNEFLSGRGKGIDIFKWEGLSGENVVEDMSHLPWPDETFESVTFIACLNHIPRLNRAIELAEAFRVLKPGGNVIITMAPPFVEIAAHGLGFLYHRLIPGYNFMDVSMGPHEDLYVSTKKILSLLASTGFQGVRKKRFVTQWGMNAAFVGWKPRTGFDIS